MYERTNMYHLVWRYVGANATHATQVCGNSIVDAVENFNAAQMHPEIDPSIDVVEVSEVYTSVILPRNQRVTIVEKLSEI